MVPHVNSFKSLHINIPFGDNILKVFSYERFLGDVTACKRKLIDYKINAIMEECSAISDEKKSPKLKNSKLQRAEHDKYPIVEFQKFKKKKE